MDKFAESFKAVVAVFHGIIATWLFLDFSENSADEFHFVILLVFFTVANVLIWNAGLWIARKLRASQQKASPLIDFEHGAYRIRDGIGLTLIAIVVGLFAAYVDKHEWILSAGNRLANWERSTSAPPFELATYAVRRNEQWKFDLRSKAAVDATHAEGAYLRIFVKDSKFGYEGFPSLTSTRGDVSSREIVLSAACRFSVDTADLAKALPMQQIEGTGVFLRLDKVIAMEIIDAHQSGCAKLY